LDWINRGGDKRFAEASCGHSALLIVGDFFAIFLNLRNKPGRNLFSISADFELVDMTHGAGYELVSTWHDVTPC
jgi:hypothetical protein